MLTLYNRQGRPVAYVADDNRSIYLFGGEPVAWQSDEHVYSYDGRWLGWFQNDWLWDRNGHAAFFTEDAFGGPAKPARQASQARSARQARPARAAREARPARPARSSSWSSYSDESFFRQ